MAGLTEEERRELGLPTDGGQADAADRPGLTDEEMRELGFSTDEGQADGAVNDPELQRLIERRPAAQ